ncbi:hypothetical protein AB0O64_32610 [Streptomyces sp. NPDC088341]|uniref:hypothetical protein n=1 Tax=Streptomyces sp. NPDC088341 TaxID=3154870 RepID=UPI00341A2E9D
MQLDPLDRSVVPYIPEDPTFTIDQLTPADYAAVSAFLTARLRELADSGQTGAARALDEALSLHTETLGPNFQWETDYRHEPVPDHWLRERMNSWNPLVCAMWAGWHDAEGYDRTRWTLVASPRRAETAAGGSA